MNLYLDVNLSLFITLLRLKEISVFIAILLATACSQRNSPGRKQLHISGTDLFSVDVTGKLQGDIPAYYQQDGSSNVYLLNPSRGCLLRLDLNGRRLNNICRLPPVPRDVRVVGLTVEERKRLMHVFFMDSAVTYSLSGTRISSFAFEGLSAKGFLYPYDKSFIPICKNGHMYLPYYPNVEGDAENPAFCAQPVEAAIELKSRKVRLLHQAYPANYRKNHYPLGTEPNRMEVSKTIHAYCFPQNDSVFLRDIHTGKLLEKKFFGSRMVKKFEYIPYRQIKSVNVAAFKEVALSNPAYCLARSLPQSGFFVRQFIVPPHGNTGQFRQYLLVFDRNFNYLGEIRCDSPFGYIIDSSEGLLTMRCKDNTLIVRKLSW